MSIRNNKPMGPEANEGGMAVGGSGVQGMESGQPRNRYRRSRAPSVTWDQIIDPVSWVKIAVLSLLILWLYSHDIESMVTAWVHDGNWSHGFIIPLFSLYFLHQRREQLLGAKRETSWAGVGLIVFSILLYLISIYPLKMGYPRLIAMLMTIFGTVLFCCGWKVIKVTWLPILYLFFAMPLPQRIYVELTMPMRRWASTFSAAFLDMLPNLEANATSVVIEGFYKGVPFTLNVAEACAGMRLMMAFFALSVAMAYLSDRPWWHRVILVCSSFPIALFCNFVRVTVTGILYVMVDPIYAKGGFHTALGLLMLPLAFFLYWVIAWMMNKIYEEVEEGADHA
ncbi:MAG: exosortase/archaeosortase family protein [Phycisphaerae bacterium]|nr:exosortase/archaeosortase family protein [Phycisphaerae bacterium]